jgi:hypothetical protein
MHTLESTMKNVIAGELHIVVAERQDQITGIFWTRNPHQHLANLASATHLGRVEIRACPYAPRVIDGVGRRLSPSIDSQSAGSFWSRADFEEILAAVDEYDLATGRRIANAGVKVGDPVHVAKHGRGRVKSMSHAGLINVALDRPDGDTIGVVAHRSMVKPILRAVHT